ncbi:RHS repeat-associated core domain-containing protein [Streptomyces sioyaensis]|uniref:RHS repeat-associated core domain-containing protein n=1 Tax=Streptomyces sioyaensis TaxID=67364 RepID=UPI0033FA50E6
MDEDDYREMADAMREFADDIDGGANEAHQAVQGLVGSAGGSLAVEALNAHWGKINGTHLKNLGECGRLAGTALDGVALLIEGAKIGAIAQLAILAAEVIAAQAAAPFTFGLSELGALAGTQATRLAVRRIFKEVCQQVAEQVISIALTPVEEALGAMVGDLVVQLGANALGVQDGIDVGHAAQAGKEGFNQGVHGAKDSAKSAAANPMQLLSAGGESGGGGGGGSNGGFSFDPDEHDRAVTGLQSAGGTFRNKAGGKIGRAKSHHGRTRGKDAIADAANVMLDKVIDGIEDGVKKTAKHLDDNMTRGIKQMAKNHHDNDQKLADHFKGLGKVNKKEPKSPTTSLNSAGKSDGSGGRPGKNSPGLAGPAKGGQPSEGNVGCHTAGDPVDVISGQMITNERDLELPGLLPLILRRAYASHYAGGRLHGPGWSSTVDQRVEIDSQGIHYAGDDAQILHYPRPSHSGEQVHPEAGARWPLTWDQETDLISIEDPDQGWTRYFAPTGAVTGLTRPTRAITELADRNGHRIAFVRDEVGTLTEIRHTGGYRVAVDALHTSAGLRIEGLRLLDGSGSNQGITIVRYEYDSAGRLAGVVNSSGLPYEYEYDDADRITTCIDRNGRCYAYVYDESGRVIRGIGEEAHLSASFDYDVRQRVTTVTDSLGHATEYHYNEQQRVIKTVDPLGHTTLTAYDAAGRVIARTDEVNRTTAFDLDRHGDPVRITEPDGGTIELDYTELRQLAAVRRGDTLLASFAYDARGNVLITTDAAGARTSRQYDDNGRLVSITDPLGQTRHTTTNPAGLITAITDAMGHTLHAAYDAFGRVVSCTDPLGATTRFEYRTEGETTRRIHPDGAVETWIHDPEGYVVEHRDQTAAVTRFEVGPFGQLVGRTLPDGEVQRFAYDTEQRLLSVTANGAAWRYRYDEAGHLVGETDFNGRSLAYQLDGSDQLLGTTDAAGRTSAYTYDGLGRLVEHRNDDGTVTSLTYDESGLLKRIAGHGSVLEYTHDRVGRVLSETVDGRTTTYTYDALSRRTSRTTPSGLVSTWTYDANNQPADVTNPLGHLSFAYDASGRETTRYLGSDAALTQTWDACDRLSAQAIWALDGTTKAADSTYTNTLERTYGYRADGMPTVVTDQLRGRRNFGLTSAGRITRVDARSWSESYAYDPLGNITHAHDTRMPDSATSGERAYTGSLLRSAGRTFYEYDGQGRLVRTLVRTLSGQRREWHYTWNAEDQLVQVDTPGRGSWRYTYDPLGRRLSKRRLSEQGRQPAAIEETFFVWDGTQLIEQSGVLADGSRRTLTWDWEPGAWKPLSQTERTWRTNRAADQASVDERFYAIVTDLSGTVSELITPDGRIAWSDHADTWGLPLRGTGRAARACPLGRPGQYHDAESGLQYNYFRYYDPATGRYISSDPLGLNGGTNPHAYVPNPLFWIDPLGLAKRQPEGWGGSHYSLRPSNWTDGSDNNSYERNHMPARAAYVGIGGTQLGYGAGPAIRMEYQHHRDFISTGSGPGPDKWRADQRALIAQGKFDEAMKKDIDEIRRVHGTRYDAAIKEMVDHLPHNKPFQKYLSDNGWKIRTCLLK